VADQSHHDVVVIGSGFGATMTALALAREFKGSDRSILMLERGTWWTTPVGTVADKEVKTYDFLVGHGQPVQYWSSVEHFRGFVDIFLRCLRRRRNEDGLYDLTTFGRRGFLGIGAENDGVTILHANGVGGGSLVYANVTIQPPDFIFEEERWPTSWGLDERNGCYELARQAIGDGVLFALNKRGKQRDPAFVAKVEAGPANTGLSNIVTRAAGQDPKWHVKPDANNLRGIKQLDPTHSSPAGAPPDNWNSLWIDRARIFQKHMSALTNDWGTVDSSINDVPPGGAPIAFKGQPQNYCERQGRCIIGCLSGARHTLNKQLMRAILGSPKPEPPFFESELSLQTLSEVDHIRALPGGGYAVHYLRRNPERPHETMEAVVTADRVIVAAGCVGTNEIMLRSKQRAGLPNLSDRVGYGFSTNGDWLAFVDETTDHISLTRGPVTTSFGHFNTPAAAEGADPERFHTIEDNGIPRAFSELTGLGVPLLRSLSKGRRGRAFVAWSLILFAAKRVPAHIRAFFRNYVERQDEFRSEDEFTAKMMCIAAMGREQARGQFRLGGGPRESALRVARDDGKGFHEDPIYKEIEQTLNKFATALTDGKRDSFENPFVSEAAGALGSRSIGLSHPLGGCRMATSAADGVVDEYGRVFDKQADASAPFYPGLYITDASIIPTSLGVNPSLTISALALRAADKMIEEVRAGG